MFTPYFKPYSEVVQKKINNKNCSVSSLVSNNTVGVIVSLLLPKRQQVNNRNAKMRPNASMGVKGLKQNSFLNQKLFTLSD